VQRLSQQGASQRVTEVRRFSLSVFSGWFPLTAVPATDAVLDSRERSRFLACVNDEWSMRSYRSACCSTAFDDASGSAVRKRSQEAQFGANAVLESDDSKTRMKSN
jgi:hypothetical protein